MQFKPRNLRAVAEMVIGDVKPFQYRSSSYITEFFEDCGLPFRHDGSTRWSWTADRLAELLAEPQPSAHALPDRFMVLLRTLMDLRDAPDDDPNRLQALAALNVVLLREGFEAYYAEDRVLYTRHMATNTTSAPRIRIGR